MKQFISEIHYLCNFLLARKHVLTGELNGICNTITLYCAPQILSDTENRHTEKKYTHIHIYFFKEPSNSGDLARMIYTGGNSSIEFI